MPLLSLRIGEGSLLTPDEMAKDIVEMPSEVAKEMTKLVSDLLN